MYNIEMKNVRGRYSNYVTLNDIQVRGVERRELESRDRATSTYLFDNDHNAMNYGLKIINHTKYAVSIVFRNGLMSTLNGLLNESTSIRPASGIFIRVISHTSRLNRLSYHEPTANACASRNERKVLGEHIDDFIKQAALEPTPFLPHGLEGKPIEYFIPIEDVESLPRDGLYVPELDIMLGLDGSRLAHPHPRVESNSLAMRLANQGNENIEIDDTKMTMYVNDTTGKIKARYITIGDSILRINVKRNRNEKDGFYVINHNEFNGGIEEDEQVITRMRYYTLEEARIKYGLTFTAEESHNKIIDAANKAEELKQNGAVIQLKAEQTKATIQATSRKTITEEMHKKVQYRKDTRSELLDWFKFIIQGLTTVFAIVGIFSR